MAGCGGGSGDDAATAALSGPALQAQEVTGAITSAASQVMPPDAEPYGVSYAQWGVKWWQWALGIPAAASPYIDQDGSCLHGAEGQDGDVWFLAGVMNESGKAERNCTIPPGKAILIPVINVECSSLEGQGKTEPALAACLRKYLFGGVSATIDGVKVPDIERYYVESPLAPLTLPVGNILNVEAGTGPSLGKGYYLMLSPLRAGSRHTINFKGGFPDYAFWLDITYHIDVLPTP